MAASHDISFIDISFILKRAGLFGRHGFAKGTRGKGARLKSVVFVGAVLALNIAGARGAGAFIAGVEPGKHRTDIPPITKVTHDAAWKKQALHGISQPVPQHVQNFLKDQGNWFSPFVRPGMHGRYDIRHWHKGHQK